MSQVSCDSPSLGVTLMSVDSALSALESLVVPLLESEVVDLSAGLQRVLANDVYSNLDVPPLANSAMDGYAVTVTAGAPVPREPIEISQRIPAGTIGSALKAGTAARIFTGAPIPEGANAVVMQELCNVDGTGNSVVINDDVGVGQNIRFAGEDIAQGDCVLKAGKLLHPQELGLLASLGCSTIKVIKKLRVAVLFTGDELVQPGDDLDVGQIYNSNQYTLIGLLERLGCEVVNFGIVEDTLTTTIDALADAASKSDLVITSGGVSVGEEDHVKAAVASLGSLDLWRIAIKPGKPLAFGQVSGVPFLGLPGNPVSVFVTACVFARPFIKAMQGLGFNKARGLMVPAAFELKNIARREEYLRVRLSYGVDDVAVLEVFPNQGSGVLTSASWATGLAVVKQGSIVSQGELLEYMPFSTFDI
ncbi:gephyrin-like molybdotransferase Glp [Leucothrix arctica]|uniref:Molybdopterin molybdenumtransferase n=1 Tax=Leucothrix arctica TaxID=1481894 RepID=A0A317C6D1_9GAMM|nr:gephyrin-like molybdotransferase Glp [Leucothrix arctica]PWQ92963.1 molybdopterin molybdenumtransferase MoeA [Leucothrix arctica]